MRVALIAVVLATAAAAHAEPRPHRVLRVCADPSTHPGSSRAGGLENDLAAVLARELGAKLVVTSAPPRRGVIRTPRKAERCDVVFVVSGTFDSARTTAPIYRSAYAFVSRADRALAIRSFDDPRLPDLRIGVQLGGDDGAPPPPVHALARRDIVANVTGYSGSGEDREERARADALRALEAGEIDVAIVWGPTAASYARRAKTPLVVTAVAELEDGGLPMAFTMALGVRHGDRELATAIDRALVARRADIVKVLDRWRVPRLALEGR